ncbi:glucosamine 6-phosphate N-acetyltransferase-like [Watersipora subatra]|uniref:glucosamine 6-phosphate N-acetyltransferase-like n=1 Tax=Watersipora subatra TaxID=2589382 RepID=UPI00355BC8F8
MSKKYIFDEALLRELNFEDQEGISFNNSITQNDPGENLKMRPLSRDDYNHGYYKLLAQLSAPGNVTKEEFESRFDEMAACSDTYYIFVIEDTNSHQLVASCTVAVEKKFIRGCCRRGRIEDVVVDEAYRGRELGKLIVLTGKKLARKLGCYKLTLDCSTEKIPFYEKFGLRNDECNFMVIRF